MYLHLGNDTVVQMKHVIGIFDIENASLSKHTKQFLSRSTKNDEVFNVSYEMPKSFIVCQEEERSTVYVSQISPQTLLKRSKK
ncbi:Uncharacterised protein [uncultured Ruminococcus sp.]|uniref:DUF370 domain-containing protein n=1 Tax=Massiliimalia timonensis TaxID=1987501 RepID=A0A8J6PEV4_9FIRM|nr:extracellular matrix/biofilm biosynthesis regulator RemA family protein [Massiliimalia timonensis]MBC8610891.1 DUF370 domain-containing protein [Massiliimalia timonensis]SCI02392.1 Uncharacterised protein [uncultured Clostridium sp.]SCI15801.1 Uncharacterised protein [uncultured Ruminococcus sp.]